MTSFFASGSTNKNLNQKHAALSGSPDGRLLKQPEISMPVMLMNGAPGMATIRMAEVIVDRSIKRIAQSI